MGIGSKYLVFNPRSKPCPTSITSQAYEGKNIIKLKFNNIRFAKGNTRKKCKNAIISKIKIIKYYIITIIRQEDRRISLLY